MDRPGPCGRRSGHGKLHQHGGVAAVKESIEHEAIRSDLLRLGEALGWNGALSIDAILTSDGPRYIDVNPRIVEPMNALLAGWTSWARSFRWRWDPGSPSSR